MATLKAVPEYGGAWYEGTQLNIGSTNSANQTITDIAQQLNAKVVQTQYRDSDVQRVFTDAKSKITGYNAISYRYDSPDTMTLRIAMKEGQTADITQLGQLPPHIEVKIVPMETLSQLTSSVTPDLIESGDIFYTIQPNELELTCSFAFPAVAPDGTNARISAGHCREEGTTPMVKVGDSYEEVGSYDIVNFAPDTKIPADVSGIKLKDQTLPNPPTISAHGNGADIQLTGIVDPIPGAPVCKSGSYTGVTCGTIIDIRSQDMNQGTYIDGFGTNADSFPGDSGGGAFIGTKAVGIQSGSTIDKNTHQLLSTNFTKLSTALQALPGYYVKTTSEASYPVIAPLRDTWLKDGGKDTTGDSIAMQKKVGNNTIQNFEKGDLVNSATGTFFVNTDVKEQWDKNGGLSGSYGAPIAQADVGSFSVRQNFEHGTVEISTGTEGTQNSSFWQNVKQYVPEIISGLFALAAVVLVVITLRRKKQQ
ncbi:MAG: S1 family peptidase [Micrococcaceae bacterium]